MDHLGKMNPVLRVSSPIYRVSKDIDGKMFIRSFICHMKKHAVKQSMKWQVSSNFQIYLGKSDDGPPLISKSHRISKAIHCIQLYMLSSFMCCYLELTCWTGQSYIYFCSKFLSIYSCCCAFDCILLFLC